MTTKTTLKQEMQDIAKAMPLLSGQLERWSNMVDRVEIESLQGAIDKCDHCGYDGQAWKSELEQYLAEMEQSNERE